MSDAPQVAPSDPWFRTRSPEQAIHLRQTAFYPHRLTVLGPWDSFGLIQRVSRFGPITVGDVAYVGRAHCALGVADRRLP